MTRGLFRPPSEGMGPDPQPGDCSRLLRTGPVFVMLHDYDGLDACASLHGQHMELLNAGGNSAEVSSWLQDRERRLSRAQICPVRLTSDSLTASYCDTS